MNENQMSPRFSKRFKSPELKLTTRFAFTKPFYKDGRFTDYWLVLSHIEHNINSINWKIADKSGLHMTFQSLVEAGILKYDMINREFVLTNLGTKYIRYQRAKRLNYEMVNK